MEISESSQPIVAPVELAGSVELATDDSKLVIGGITNTNHLQDIQTLKILLHFYFLYLDFFLFLVFVMMLKL